MVDQKSSDRIYFSGCAAFIKPLRFDTIPLHPLESFPKEPQVERIEILLKLFFGNEIAIVDSIRHVKQFQDTF
jgi:hypothetical protein